MKKNYTIYFVILLFVFLYNCNTITYANKYRLENDDIKKTKRYIYENTYSVEENKTSVIRFEKIFFREQEESGKNKVEVFDILKLKSTAQKLDTLAYLVTETQKFNIRLQNIEKEIGKEIDTDSQKIMKSDSTTMKVITSYKELEYQYVKFNFTLTDSMIQSILQSNFIKFRYYSGVEMMTLVIKEKELQNVKKVLNV